MEALPTIDEAFGPPPTPRLPNSPLLRRDASAPPPGMIEPGGLSPADVGDNWATFEVAEDGVHKTVVLPTQPGDRPGDDATGFMGDAIARWMQNRELMVGAFEDETAAQALMKSVQPPPAPADDTQLPTVDEAFGPQPDNFIRRSDKWLQRKVTNIFNAFGYSAQEAFGSEPIATPYNGAVSPEMQEWMRKKGIWNDWAAGQNDVYKGLFEGVFKNAAAAFQLGERTLAAAAAAPLGMAGQALEEFGLVESGGRELAGLASDPGAAMIFPFGEPLAMMANARRAANLRTDLGTARANAVLAEGEAGYYGARELTPENAQARIIAAEDAGIPPPAPEPAAPNVDVLARRIDPDTFERYDALEAVKNEQRDAIRAMAAQREALPEVVQAQNEIDTTLGKVRGVEDRLTNKARERLADAQARLTAALSQDTPEMAAARQKLMEADFAQRDMVESVASAYRQAHEMMPDPMPKVAGAMEDVSAGKPIPTLEELQVAARDEDADLRALSNPAVPEAAMNEPQASPTVTAERVTPPKAPSGALKGIPGTGSLKTRTLAEGIEENAIANELTETFGELPAYNEVNMADQAAQATALLASDEKLAKDIAMGLKPAPRGLVPEAVLVAVERQAIASGDVETLRQLATESRLTTAATTMGQRIRTLGERDKLSPVDAIRDIQNARVAELERRSSGAIRNIVREMKAAVARSASTRENWATFINTIQCAD